MSIQGYPVIDAHAHIMPMRMIKPAPLAEWRRTYGAKTDEIRAILESPERVLAHLDQEGIDKVVCINYCSFPAFHSSTRQFYHSIAHMINTLRTG